MVRNTHKGTGKGIRAFLCTAIIALLASTALAVEPPKWIQMEKVGLSSGVKVGTWTLRFSLYDDQFFGSSLWSEDVQVKVVNVLVGGRYVKQVTKVVLGKVNPLQGIDFAQQMYIGVSTTGGTPLCVRFPIDVQHVRAGVMPYTLHSDTADFAAQSVSADTATTCINWTDVSCPNGQYLKGFDAAGSPQCAALPSMPAVSCSNGQCLNGFTAAGTPTCVPCGSATQQAPTVTTGTATAISQTGASLNGTVNPNSDATNGWFEYGTTTSYGTATSPQQSMGSGSGAVTLGPKTITGLPCGTLYHFRAMASNSGGTSNGSDQTFITSACSQTPPTVTTGAASSITQTGASLNGTVNPNGAATNGWFEYGTTSSYGTATSPQQSMGSGSGAVALGPKAITGLTCGTPYHFRAVASNSGGTTNGLDQTFTTSVCSGTSIPFDATNWEGETWIGNGFEGSWLPPVTAGVGDFAGENCRINMVRTKAALISKGQTTLPLEAAMLGR